MVSLAWHKDIKQVKTASLTLKFKRTYFTQLGALTQAFKVYAKLTITFWLHLLAYKHKIDTTLSNMFIFQKFPAIPFNLNYYK